jgi:hypothetical protein
MYIIELTAPMEHNFEENHSRKMRKYQSLGQSFNNQYDVRMHAVEVGARGMAATTMMELLIELGMSEKQQKTFVLHLQKWLSTTRDYCSINIERKFRDYSYDNFCYRARSIIGY